VVVEGHLTGQLLVHRPQKAGEPIVKQRLLSLEGRLRADCQLELVEPVQPGERVRPEPVLRPRIARRVPGAVVRVDRLGEVADRVLVEIDHPLAERWQLEGAITHATPAALHIAAP
jgi:hypothetical protein